MNPVSVLTLFGTRPEAIKLAPVIRALRASPQVARHVAVCSSQHTDLLRPFLGLLEIEVDHDLQVMRENQTPAAVLARLLPLLEDLIRRERPDLIVVQGDTATALAGALAGFYARVPVAHVEAGLRTGDLDSPFPEEMHRRTIGLLADLHLAATPANAQALVAEGCAADRIVITGNPVVDSLHWIAQRGGASSPLRSLLDSLRGQRVIALTTHRRENIGAVMEAHLRAVAEFVAECDDVAVVFPVHPNPQVRLAAQRHLGGRDRVHLIEPLDYTDFVHLLSRAWLVCSDSGGIQEEAPSLGKPLLILRDTTERREVIDCGVGRLVGHGGRELLQRLRQSRDDLDWHKQVRHAINPFGNGDAGQRIAEAIVARYATRPGLGKAA